MATINPSNLYSGGNVLLDPNPYLRISIQQRARKQALKEASTQYFSRLPDKINTAGVREQDLQDPNGNGGILNEIDGMKEYWLKNKESILKGGKAQQDYGRLISGVNRKIQESKFRAKTELKIGQEALKTNGWKPRDEDHPIISALGKSIYDPTSKKEDGVTEYTLNDFSLAAPAYTPNVQNQFEKSVRAELKPEYDPTTKAVEMDASGKILLTKRYTKDAIKSIADRSAAMVESNPTLKYHYEDLMDDEKIVQSATQALQSVYGSTDAQGNPIVADTPQKMAAADQIIKAQGTELKEEEKDVVAANRFKKQLQDERLAAQMKRTKLTEAGKNKRASLLAPYQITSIYDKINDSPTVSVTTPLGDKIEMKEVSNLTNAEQDDMFGKPDKYGVRPNAPIELEGKNFVKVKNGVLVDNNDTPYDADAVVAKTFSRLKSSKEAQAKGKAVITTNPSTTPTKKKAKYD